MTSKTAAAPVELLDARGLFCPVPVLRTRDRLRSLPPSGRLDVLADDPLARLDLRAFCAQEGHTYLEEREEPDGGWRMALQKSSGAPRP